MLINLLDKYEYIDFLVGRNGEFDRIVSSSIKRIKKEYAYKNCSHILVLPYDSAEYRYNEDSFDDYYDRIEICKKSSNSHFKSAIQIRNKDIVDRSDLIICYIESNNGGAYQTVQYAKKQGKKVRNLADEI